MAGFLNSPIGATAPLLEPLRATLQLWAEQPFHPRTANCVLSVTDYVEGVLGREAAQRPHDLGPVARQKLWDSEAELVAYCAQLFGGQLGLRETEAPVRGDIGLVHGMSPSLTAAICLAPGKWAARGQQGVVAGTAAPLIAWAMPEGAA